MDCYVQQKREVGVSSKGRCAFVCFRSSKLKGRPLKSGDLSLSQELIVYVLMTLVCIWCFDNNVMLPATECYSPSTRFTTTYVRTNILDISSEMILLVDCCLVMYHDITINYLLWLVFYHTSNCNMLCYDRRCVYEHAAV